MNNNIDGLNQVIRHWENPNDLLLLGMNYLKKNRDIINTYHRIWVEAKKTGENSESARNAREALCSKAIHLYEDCKELQKHSRQQLAVHLDLFPNSTKTTILSDIVTASNAASECFKSIFSNPNVNGTRSKLWLTQLSLTAIGASGCVYAMFRLPLPALFGPEIKSSDVAIAFSPLVIFADYLILKHIDSSDAKMTRMIDLLEHTLGR